MDQKKIATSVDEYIMDLPEEGQGIATQVRQTILKAAPEAKESISWGMPTYKMKKVLLHFAVHTHHIGLYPTPEAVVLFADRLQSYETTSKGTIRFPFSKPLPLDLIEDIVRYRVGVLNGEK